MNFKYDKELVDECFNERDKSREIIKKWINSYMEGLVDVQSLVSFIVEEDEDIASEELVNSYTELHCLYDILYLFNSTVENEDNELFMCNECGELLPKVASNVQNYKGLTLCYDCYYKLGLNE